MNSRRTQIRQSFDRAAARYDAAAVVQRHAVDWLLEALPCPKQSVLRVLDGGCGTGYALPLLAQRYRNAAVIALDLAPGMLAQCRLRGVFPRIAADLEQLPLPDASIDVFFSSLSFQWCSLPLVLAEARRILAPGGLLAFATLGPETFHELRQAFAGIDTYRHTLPFSDPAALASQCQHAGFASPTLFRETRLTYHADPGTLMRSVKQIGANRVGEGARTSLLGKKSWQQVCAAFEAWRTPEGLPLSYDLITCYASVQP